MREVDVLVVGAGPAGSVTARELAERGVDVLLTDREAFPRAKTCGGWVNAKVVEDFPWLAADETAWAETAFSQMVIHSPDLSRNASWRSSGTAGYFVKRERFDAYLVGAAREAGAAFEVRESSGIKGKVVTFRDGEEVTAKAIVAADGSGGRLSVEAGLRAKWGSEDLAVSGKLETACAEGTVAMHVVPAYSGLSGYGWVFQKGTSASVGIGGSARRTSMPQQIFERFLSDARKMGLVRDDVTHEGSAIAFIPAGGVLREVSLVKGRVLSVGDAGGFVSAASGEGIYPGMLSGKLAAQVIGDALETADQTKLGEYEERARRRIAPGLRADPATLMALMPLAFDDARITERLARYFLFGEGLL